MGKKLGQADDPLLVSVRSGAAASMPGMMETVLNVGLNDESVQGLAAQSTSERFAWDSYRRLLSMFGRTVLDIEGHLFEEALERRKEKSGVEGDLELDADDLKALVETYQEHHRGAERTALPPGPPRAARPRRAGGLRVLEHRARDPLPPPGADPLRPRHRGQRVLDGVRQPR